MLTFIVADIVGELWMEGQGSLYVRKVLPRGGKVRDRIRDLLREQGDFQQGTRTLEDPVLVIRIRRSGRTIERTVPFHWKEERV